MKYIKLFESFDGDMSDFVSSLMDFESCDVVIFRSVAGNPDQFSYEGVPLLHWHEHFLRIKFSGLILKNKDFVQNKSDYAFEEIQKGNFEILDNSSDCEMCTSMGGGSSSFLPDVKEVLNRDYITEIADEYDQDDLEEFAERIRGELKHITLDWIAEMEDSEYGSIPDYYNFIYSFESAEAKKKLIKWY